MGGQKILFVCSRNRWRSLTAEKIFDGVNGIQARSAGTEPNARIKVRAGHLSWADLIFVMEKKHLRRLQDRFPDEIAGKEVVCLHIADDYEFMQPELLDILKAGVEPYLNS
jgi:predicted protein tyrosine phosphatase